MQKSSAMQVDLDTVIIDVRSLEEYAQGHIENSINIPIDEIDSALDQFDKDQKIIVCCQSGNRSERAKFRLEDLGFKHVENGGSWKSFKS